MVEQPATSTVRSALAIDRACDAIMRAHPDPAEVARNLGEILTAVRDLRAHQVDDVLAHIGVIGQRYGTVPDRVDHGDRLGSGVDGEDDGQRPRAHIEQPEEDRTRARADELAERVRGE